MTISVTTEAFRLEQPFVISRGAKTAAEVVTVRVARGGDLRGGVVARGAPDGRAPGGVSAGAGAGERGAGERGAGERGAGGGLIGWGESVPYARYGETPAGVVAAISALPEGIDRLALQAALPAGAARNAVDCALWDLQALQAGRRVWELAGLVVPGPVLTAFTLSIGPPAAMEAAARANATRPLLKIKLGSPDDMPRLEAVRRGAPRARIIVDANEGWTAAVYAELAPHLIRLGVELVELPLPAGADDMLAEIARPLPVCADESCHDRASLPALRGKYDMVNIKLDKAGGLTEALALRDAARAQGFGVMVGCMVGTSLAMAPAVLLAQGADYVDLDGPLLLAEDRPYALRYDAAGVHPPEAELWG